jgi:DNA-binding PadR family transcriptional regulator
LDEGRPPGFQRFLIAPNLMKFIIWINQPKSLEWELSLQQSFLFACVYELPSWAEQVVVGNETFYWCSKTVLAAELPMITDKVDSIYRWLNQLQEKGLIIVKKQGKKDLIKLTSKGREWNSKNSDDHPNPDSNPTIFGSPSGKNPDDHPTYPNTNTDQITKIRNAKISFCKKIIDWATANVNKYPKLILILPSIGRKQVNPGR